MLGGRRLNYKDTARQWEGGGSGTPREFHGRALSLHRERDYVAQIRGGAARRGPSGDPPVVNTAALLQS